MNLDATNYHSEQAGLRYFSNSQVTKLRECSAKEIACITGKWKRDEPSDAMLIGSYVDRALLTPESLDEWCECNIHLMRSEKTKKAYAWTFLAPKMVERARRDDSFMRVLTGKPQDYITWSMFGHEWKAALDIVNVEKSYFADLKTCPELGRDYWDDELRKKVAWYHVYFQQIAVYREAYKAKYGKHPSVAFLAAVTKQDPPDLGLVLFDDSHAMRYEHELGDIAQNIDAWAKMKRGEMEPTRCESCDYCRATKVLDGSKIMRAVDSRYERTV